MTNFHNVAIVAIASLCLPTAGAMAAERVPVTAAISTADLDLATPEGRAKLETRVAVAIRHSCGSSGSRSLAEQMDSARCMSEMRADSAARIAALIERSPATRVASAEQR